MPVAELVKFEQLRDVGEAQRDYSQDRQRDQGGAVGLLAFECDGLCLPDIARRGRSAASRASRSMAAARPISPLRGDAGRRGGCATSVSADRLPLHLLMAPALAWLTALMVVPCALVLALAFFRRGIYGGIEYTFTLENFGLVFDPLYAGIFLNSARIAGTATLIAARHRLCRGLCDRRGAARGCSRSSCSSPCCRSGRTT